MGIRHRKAHGAPHIRFTNAKTKFRNCELSADGNIVCARLGPGGNAEKEKWPLGSPNFVLLKHRMTLDNKEARIAQGTLIPFSQISAQGVQTTFQEAKLQLETLLTREAALNRMQHMGKGMALVSYSISRMARSTRDMILGDGLACPTVTGGGTGATPVKSTIAPTSTH